MTSTLRPQLGDFNSIICFKAAIAGMEEALGTKATAIGLIAAGRARGKKLAKELSLSLEAETSLEAVASKLRFALGETGTRLCIVEKIVWEGEGIKVYVSEALCSVGEPQGSERRCTFTLGAVWGALEQVLGKRLKGQHTESVLQGATYDVFEFNTLV